MREIQVSKITDAIARLCTEANITLSEDMENAVKNAADRETSQVGCGVMSTLLENLKIARAEDIPICQDTGMAVVFLEIGQDVHISGGDLTKAVNAGVAKGYTEGYLRKSVVSDPILRVNTNDNTPAVIHTSIVPGDRLRITLTPKGFGSENMSRIHMLKPADGEDGIKNAIVNTVIEAGPNACPPVVVGVGIGGDFEYAAIMAKKALTRNTGEASPLPHIAAMEAEVLDRINASGIGPGGLGGQVTALAVHINTYPTHIAGLPVAVNMCCHVNRHASAVL